MESYLIKLEINYCNLINSKKISKKENILNNILNIIKYNRALTDFINYLYCNNEEFFNNLIETYNKPSLVLLLYDIKVIEKLINLPQNFHLLFYDNLFHIDEIISDDNNQNTDSNVESDFNSNDEWGLS